MASSPSTQANLSNGSAQDVEVGRYRKLGDGSYSAQSSTAADWGYSGISTATTTVVKSGSGQLHQVIVAGGTLGAITIYDNTAASGTVIVPTFTPPTLTGPFVLTLDVSFGVGLTIVTAAATVVTVTYK